jgi:hypothetical protein
LVPSAKAEGYRYTGGYTRGGIEYIPGYTADASKLSRRSDASRAKNHDNHENF